MDKEKVNVSKKKLIAIIAAVVVVIVGVILLIICLGKKEKSNEKELKANLEKLGVQFYEDFYYPAQEKTQKDVKAFIAKFEKTGVKVNLENISKISVVDKKLVESMVNSVTNEKCDVNNTYVVVKPVSPYGKKDHKIEVNLSCGDFGKKAKKSTSKKEDSPKKTVTTKKEETKKEETKKNETVKKAETKKSNTKKK